MSFNLNTRPLWYRRAQWKAAWSKRNGVHYVDDDVIIDLHFAGDTFRRTATFDNGTDGAVASAAARGFYSTFTVVTDNPTYSSTHAYGDLSLKIPAASATANIEWQFDSLADQYARLYLYATTFPPSTVWLVRTQRTGLFVTSSGKLDMNGGNAFTNSIALNQWIRIELHARYGASSSQQYEVRLYNNADSLAPTETKLLTSGSTGADDTSFQFGRPGGVGGPTWGTDIWIDNVVARASSWPGPYDQFEDPAVAVTYEVRDYFGKPVSQGTFDESQQWFRPQPPSGGWKPGWYRVYLTGVNSDPNFANSYGATNFCVIKDDPHFVTMPAASTVGGYHGDQPDYVMKGVMGLGTSRLVINNAASPSADIATALADLAITKTYWTATGTTDTERVPREPWCTFPNCDGSPTELAGVTAVVQALYPDCKYFEGPSNEPNPNDPATATKMQAFQAAVHAGNANAKAIGPCPVEVYPTTAWSGFFEADGGDYCDEISFHAYNAVTNGNLNLGRYTLESMNTFLDGYGLSAKPKWQTESVHPMFFPYGIYHPRRARVPMLQWLLFEQNGVPRERNNWWYDTSHGFWDYPAWVENGDGSLEPSAVMGRVLAEETWGKPYDSAVDFGPLGNAMYIGNVYRNAAGASTVALMATSYMDGASISLAVTGTAGPVTVVSGFGEQISMPISRGRITIPMTDVPVYVRLPVGASASVYRVNGWSPLGNAASISPDATTIEIDGVSRPALADNGWLTNSSTGQGSAWPGNAIAPPSVATLLWPSDRTFERVIIWSGMCWQGYGTLIGFEIETYDGATWTTRKTVTKPTPSWFEFGTDDWGPACFRETYWDEQWVFDLELDAPVTAQGVRVNITDTSYGGEPLSAPDFGQGNTIKAYVLEEIAVADANRYAGAI